MNRSQWVQTATDHIVSTCGIKSPLEIASIQGWLDLAYGRGILHAQVGEARLADIRGTMVLQPGVRH